MNIECDVLVAGSGAAGLSAAVTAAHQGARVILVEKAPVFGGTSCFSAGLVWIPGSRQARAAGIQDDLSLIHI
jgi:succinate dehydrogenase/fumarate reductase flavoprotein subunit